MKVHYDPKVEELARYSLYGERPIHSDTMRERIARLSREIQQAIEEFLKFER